jgi:hypothetical protein
MKHAAITFLVALALTAAAPPAARAVDSFFDVFTELPVSGPPAPSAAIITLTGAQFGPDFTPTHEASVRVLSLNGLPPGEPWIGRAAGGGAGGNPPAIDSFFDIFWDFAPPSPTPVQIGLQMENRELHPPGSPPGVFVPLEPVYPEVPNLPASSFFDVFVDVNFFDITYRVLDPTGSHTYHVHGTSPGGRLSFFDVFVELHDTTPDGGGRVDSFFDVFVECSLNGLPPGEPVLRLATTGSYVPAPVAIENATWSGIKNLLR